jgi:MFS family permease
MKSTLDEHFVRNTAGISAGEFFWGMGLPVLVESTFLQVFLSSEGASNTVIGFCGAVYFLALSVMPLFSAWFSSRYSRKRTLVVLLHVVPSFSILFLGLFYFVFGARYDAVRVFLIFFLVFSFSLGLTLPVWQNYVVKIFSEKKRLRGFSVMMMSTNAAKLCAGLSITFLITAKGFSLNTAALLFTLTGVLFIIGSAAYAFTYEEPDAPDGAEIRHPVHYVLHYSGHILKNRPAVCFMLSDIEFYSISAAFAFYARYAVEEARVPSVEAGGIFAAIAFSGAVAASLMYGFFWRSKIKSKLYLAKFVSLAGLVLLVVSKSMTAFYLVSFLIGFSRGSRSMLNAPCIKRLSGLSDASPYFAIIPLLMIPFSSGISVGAGKYIDWAGGGNSYRICFAVLAGLVLLSLLFLVKTDYPERRG